MTIKKEIHISTLTEAVICSQERYDYPPVAVFISLPTDVKDEETGKMKTVGEVHTYCCMTHLSPELKARVRSELSDTLEKIKMAQRKAKQDEAKVQEMPFDKPPGWDSMTAEERKEAKAKAEADPNRGKSKIILASN